MGSDKVLTVDSKGTNGGLDVRDIVLSVMFVFFFSSRRRHTRLQGDWSSDVCSSDLAQMLAYEQLDNYEGAVDAGRKAVRLSPENLHILATLANLLPLGVTFGRTDEIGRASCRERV